jgi:SAM-dependent methyltransferase
MKRPDPTVPAGMTRRNALCRVAWAAAAPLILPSRVLGRAGLVPPSERITFGMIGTGGQMGGHLGAMLGNPGTKVLAVCDVHTGRREAARQRAENHYAKEKEAGTYRGCDAYNEYERIIERSDIDAVFIATPDHWHVAMALAAIRAGKDVYVEKPMTLTVKEGRLLSDAARRYGRVVQVGSQQRSEWAFRKAAEIVRNGWLGKIHTIYARLGDFGPPTLRPEQPIPEGFDYDRWLGPTPWVPYNDERVKGSYGGGWRCYWEYGARKNGDWGAHHYDIIQWALGKDDSGPTYFFPKGHEGKEQQGYRYENGPTIFRDHPSPTGQMIDFIGDRGSLGVSRGGVLVTTPAELRDQLLKPEEQHLYKSTSHQGNFLECIRSRAQPICHAEIGHRTSTVCHLSAISERLQRVIRWDPIKEAILGDAEAARWLDRPRRAPYTL